jgi:hypothetical protein
MVQEVPRGGLAKLRFVLLYGVGGGLALFLVLLIFDVIFAVVDSTGHLNLLALMKDIGQSSLGTGRLMTRLVTSFMCGLLYGWILMFLKKEGRSKESRRS